MAEYLHGYIWDYFTVLIGVSYFTRTYNVNYNPSLGPGFSGPTPWCFQDTNFVKFSGGINDGILFSSRAWRFWPTRTRLFTIKSL